LYESCGHYGRSNLRTVNLETGEVIKAVRLADEMFAEGLTIFKEKIYLITWREHAGFVFDLDMNQLSTFTIATSGWGLTNDGTSLIYCDGTDKIFFLNPETFVVEKTLEVKSRTAYNKDKKVPMVNELEYIDGYIFANIWGEQDIVVICPETGYVRATIKVPITKDWNKPKRRMDDVLNGIALDRDSGRLYITGKLWPSMFEIEPFDLSPLLSAPAPAPALKP
jgi:glutaminyl-peptide cyclotransferase